MQFFPLPAARREPTSDLAVNPFQSGCPVSGHFAAWISGTWAHCNHSRPRAANLANQATVSTQLSLAETQQTALEDVMAQLGSPQNDLFSKLSG